MNYYNEFDPLAAAWLRELILQGLIPYGDVDTRSIEDVEPREIAGYTQCHFFAGIGGWPLALQLAGWPDDRPIWTGSCPCQPFSAAGQGAGFADERHLWPSFHWLIEQCRPATVVGEQVASAAVGPWIDLVLTDLEALGYAVGAYAGPAAGVGAPHLRDRSYWVAHASSARSPKQRREWYESTGLAAPGVLDGLADTDGRHPGAEREQCGRQQRQFQKDRGSVGLADADDRSKFALLRPGQVGTVENVRGGTAVRPYGQLAGRDESRRNLVGSEPPDRPGPTNGNWRDADWLGCRDGKWRPVEPGTFPLAHGLPARVGRLRGYGNAIVPQQAAQFIQALMEYQCSPN